MLVINLTEGNAEWDLRWLTLMRYAIEYGRELNCGSTENLIHTFWPLTAIE